MPAAFRVRLVPHGTDTTWGLAWGAVEAGQQGLCAQVGQEIGKHEVVSLGLR